MIYNSAEWCRILMECGVRPLVAAKWGDVFADTVKEDTFRSDQDRADFLGQILHESAGLRVLVENLDYSAERLCKVWPRRFPNLGSAVAFAHNPRLLANAVYGGRMGNTDAEDGWRFRGRTPLQITGRDGYAFVGGLVGQDLTVSPEILEQPHYALEACVAWWENRIPESFIGDPEKETLRVNGGLIGLADRIALTEAAERATS